MTKTDLQEPRSELPEVGKPYYIFFGHHKFSLVPVFSALTTMIMPWGLPSSDLGTLTLRGNQVIFSPAEAGSKNHISGEL